jgi:hypothetical protein
MALAVLRWWFRNLGPLFNSHGRLHPHKPPPCGSSAMVNGKTPSHSRIYSARQCTRSPEEATLEVPNDFWRRCLASINTEGPTDRWIIQIDQIGGVNRSPGC